MRFAVVATAFVLVGACGLTRAEPSAASATAPQVLKTFTLVAPLRGDVTLAHLVFSVRPGTGASLPQGVIPHIELRDAPTLSPSAVISGAAQVTSRMGELVYDGYLAVLNRSGSGRGASPAVPLLFNVTFEASSGATKIAGFTLTSRADVLRARAPGTFCAALRPALDNPATVGFVDRQAADHAPDRAGALDLAADVAATCTGGSSALAAVNDDLAAIGPGRLGLPSTGSAARAVRAERTAFAALAPDDHHGRIVLYRLSRPLPAGTVVAVASGGGPAKARITLRRPAWLFWEDLAHGALFEHASLMALVDAHTGALIRRMGLGWYPLVGGRAPPFLGRDSIAARYAIYANVAPVTAARRRAAGLVSSHVDLRFEHDCAVLIGDRTNKDNAPQLFGSSLMAMHTFFSHGLHIPTVSAKSLKALEEKVAELIRKGCKDVVVFVAGHGSPAENTPWPGKPEVTVPGSLVPTVSLGDGEYLYPSTLRALMRAHRTAKFKILIFSCFSGRFVEELKPEPNLALIATSSSAKEYTWGYATSAYVGPNGFNATSGTIAENPLNPPGGVGLPGWVHGFLTSLGAVLASPADLKLTGGDLARMIAAANFRLAGGDFTTQIGWTTPQFYASFPLRPPPPPPPPPPPTPPPPLRATATPSYHHFGAGNSQLCVIVRTKRGASVTATVTSDFGYKSTQSAVASASGVAVLRFPISEYGTYKFDITVRLRRETVHLSATETVTPEQKPGC